MPSLFRRVAQVLLVTAMPLVATSVCAQSPAPPAQGPPPAPQDPPPQPDDGPKPAGVGSSQPPKPEEEPLEVEPVEILPATSFPGVVPSGTAPSARPFSGLFGGAAPASRRKHSLSLSGSLFAGYSTNVYPQPTDGVASSQPGVASTLAGGSGSLNYSRNWTSGGVGAFFDGSRSWVEAFRDTGDPWLTRWDVGGTASFSKDLGRRTRFNARGTASYSPFIGLGIGDFAVAGIIPPPGQTAGLDSAQARDPSVMSTAGITLSHALNRKSSVEAYYELGAQTFVAADPENFDRIDQMGGGRYRYRFSRYAGLRAGYGYRHASLGGPDSSPISNHYIDFGLDAGYGRSYALTRRTTFSFSTDSSVYVDEASTVGEENSFDPKTQVFVGGSADLTQTMGRSWVAATGFRRSVSYQVGFDRPILSNTVYASLGGLITTRLDFSATGSYSTGNVGFSGADNGFGTAQANAALRYAFSSHVAAFAQYFYYHYLFEQGVTLPGYLRPNFDRQGVSVGLTAWLPLIGSRGRR